MSTNHKRRPGRPPKDRSAQEAEVSWGCRLPKSLYDALVARADREGVSGAEVARRALVQALLQGEER